MSSQGAPCAVCSYTADVQMDNMRPLKDIYKSIKVIKQHAIFIGRKQITLCRTHHLGYHKGNWMEKPTKSKDET